MLFKICFIKIPSKKRISIETPKRFFEKRSKKNPAKKHSHGICSEGLKNITKNKAIKTKFRPLLKIPK